MSHLKRTYDAVPDEQHYRLITLLWRASLYNGQELSVRVSIECHRRSLIAMYSHS